MTTLDILVAAGIEAASRRGHGPYKMRHLTPTLARVECQSCGGDFDVTTPPAPNEIDLGGAILANHCHPVPVCDYCGERCEAITKCDNTPKEREQCQPCEN